jgi:replicative DNA helicase
MLELDKKIISILLKNNKELADFANSGGKGIFDQKYQRFVGMLLNYYRSFSSPPTLDTFLEFVGKNESLRQNIIDIWGEVSELSVDHREYNFLLEKIKSRYNKSLFDVVKNKFEEKTDDVESTNNFLFKIVNEIQNIGKKSIYKEIVLKDSVKDWLSAFKAKAENKRLAQGLLTGFKTLDYYTNGLRPGELLLIGADSGCGKSIFLINLATNCFLGENELPLSIADAKTKVWKEAKNVLYISLEMNGEEVMNRILSCMANVNSLDLDKGTISSDDAEKLKRALAYWEYGPGNLKIVDMARGCKMSNVQDIYDNCCLEFIPDLVVIDYLGLMASDKEIDAQDWQQLKDISEQMHEFSRYNRVPVASAIQLKTTKPGDGGIGLHRIGRSSMVAHNANIVLQIELREDEFSRVDSKIHCIKFRRGPMFIINNLRKEFMYTKFVDMGNNENKDAKILSEEDLTETMNMLLGK